MLRNAITCQDPKTQLNLLSDTYTWYFGKLMAMGDLTQQEKAEEFAF